MYIDASDCNLKCRYVCLLKIIDLGSEGPGICGARIFPVIVQEQSEATKLVESD